MFKIWSSIRSLYRGFDLNSLCRGFIISSASRDINVERNGLIIWTFKFARYIEVLTGIRYTGVSLYRVGSEI